MSPVTFDSRTRDFVVLDADRDNDLDLIWTSEVSEGGPAHLYVADGEPGGGFGPPRQVTEVRDYPGRLIAMDVNQDQYVDLFLFASSSASSSGGGQVLLNQGNGDFAPLGDVSVISPRSMSNQPT